MTLGVDDDTDGVSGSDTALAAIFTVLKDAFDLLPRARDLTEDVRV